MKSDTNRVFPLIETWQVDCPALRLWLPQLAVLAQVAAADLDIPERAEHGRVKMLEVSGLDTVFCLEAQPHVDDAHDRWFVLFALRASGQVLHARDIWPEDFRNWRREGHDPEESTPLELGDMAIVDGHRIHWLSGKPSFPKEADWPSDVTESVFAATIQEHWFAAACYDAVERPSRTAAEAMILARITPPIIEKSDAWVNS